jgi:hypothetical protein
MLRGYQRVRGLVCRKRRGGKPALYLEWVNLLYYGFGKHER